MKDYKIFWLFKWYLKNEKINSKIKLSNKSSFVILLFAILKFWNFGRSTFCRSKFRPTPKLNYSAKNELKENFGKLQYFSHDILPVFIILVSRRQNTCTEVLTNSSIFVTLIVEVNPCGYKDEEEKRVYNPSGEQERESERKRETERERKSTHCFPEVINAHPLRTLRKERNRGWGGGWPVPAVKRKASAEEVLKWQPRW